MFKLRKTLIIKMFRKIVQKQLAAPLGASITPKDSRDNEDSDDDSSMSDDMDMMAGEIQVRNLEIMTNRITKLNIQFKSHVCCRR